MDYRQKLTLLERRTRQKTALRIGGLVVVAVGLIFFPARSFVFRRADTSAFHTITDLGSFVPWGVACVAVGVLAIGASCLIRADLSE